MNLNMLWKRGDWAAYFGLLTNNLTNLLTMIMLLTVVVGFPKDFVYGTVAPSFGLAVCVAGLFYGWFAIRLAKKTGRSDITALPSGPSAPSIFVVTFLVLVPVYKATNNHLFALQIALVWCFLEGAILTVGAFLGDFIRRLIPRTVLLSCLGGLGLLLLAMNPLLQSFEAPTVSFVVLGIIFINWFGRSPVFAKIPTGFLLLLVGTVLAWAFGLQSSGAISGAYSSLGFNPPSVHINDFISGLPYATGYLASAIPLGLANYIFDLENIEAADAAGDNYRTRDVMLVNGCSSILGCFLGNPFPVTVYVGHAGWKSLGAGIGYTVASGLTMFIVTLFGMEALLLAVIPIAAIVPILVYIGIVTANQVVREAPKIEVPVIFVCLFPWIANWALTILNNALTKAGTSAAKIGLDVLGHEGIYYKGLSALGNGAPLLSMIWGCITIFAITDRSIHGLVTCGVGAMLTFLGFIHSARVGIAQTELMPYVYGYLMLLGLFAYKYFMVDLPKLKATLAAVPDEYTGNLPDGVKYK